MYFSKIQNDQIGPQTVPFYCPFLVLVTSHCIQQIQKSIDKSSQQSCVILKFRSGVYHIHFVLGGLFDAVFVKFLQNPFGVYEHLSHAKPIFLTVEGKQQNRQPFPSPPWILDTLAASFVPQNSFFLTQCRRNQLNFPIKAAIIPICSPQTQLVTCSYPDPMSHIPTKSKKMFRHVQKIKFEAFFAGAQSIFYLWHS